MDALQELLSGIKKIPTAIAGGAVDLTNLALGVLTGKGLGGITEKPVGGSAWLNEKFGIQGEGAISDMIEMIGSSLNPASAGKSLAVLVPAIVTKEANTILKAQRALKKGADPAEIFAETGIYQNPASNDLMAVISDAESRIRMNQFDTRAFNSTNGPAMFITHPTMEASALEDVLYHPELFDRIPDLKNVEIRGKFLGGLGDASYSPSENMIRLGSMGSPLELQSSLLHETQHAIQNMFDLPFGGNTGMFFADRKAFDEASSVITSLRKELTQKILDGSVPVQAATLADSLKAYGETLAKTKSQASRNYLALAGEAEARLVEEMFKDAVADPIFAKAFPLHTMESELGRFGITPDKLINPARESIVKVDEDPVVKAIVEFAKGQKK